MGSLTAKRKRFVEAYCGPAHLNASQAARDAGYAEASAPTEGWRLLMNADIQKAIAKRMEKYSMSATEATGRIAAMARGGITKRVVKRTRADGSVETEEYDTKDSLDKVMKTHGAYAQPEHQEVKFLVVRDLSEVEATE